MMVHVAIVPCFLHIAGPIHAEESQINERRQHEKQDSVVDFQVFLKTEPSILPKVRLLTCNWSITFPTTNQ